MAVIATAQAISTPDGSPVYPQSYHFNEDPSSVPNPLSGKKYMTSTFKKQHGPALFKYLCSQGFSDVIVTDESKELGFKYLCSKDELTAWFDSYFERDDREMVSVKDIFNQLKRTSFYTEMDKKEKRLFTYNSLVTNLQKSLALNKYLLDAGAYHHGKRVKGYTIKGWKSRPDMMDDGW